MIRKYTKLPNGDFIADVPRSGSMATKLAVGRTFYPELTAEIEAGLTDPFPALKEMHLARVLKQLLPFTEDPQGGDILIHVRDPYDRFASAAGMFGLDAALEMMKTDEEHFCLQSSFKFTHAFAFPSEIDKFCKHSGLPGLPVTNGTDSKPKLSKKIKEIVSEHYAPDFELLEKVLNNVRVSS